MHAFRRSVEIETAPTWAPGNKYKAQTDWQSVDRALRTIVGRRAALDADEARWLREAEASRFGARSARGEMPAPRRSQPAACE